MLHCLWTELDLVPFGVRDRNKYRVLLWLSCVCAGFSVLLVWGFFNFFFSLPPCFVRMGKNAYWEISLLLLFFFLILSAC